MDRKKTIEILADSEEEKVLLSHLLDIAERTRQKNIPAVSDFLSPSEQKKALQLMQAAGYETSVGLFGGFEGAERCRMVFAPEWDEPRSEMAEMTALKASFYEGETLNHRDFLGSLLGLGIQRKCLGDIIVHENDAVVILEDTMADFVLQQWDSAGRVHLEVSAISLEEIEPPAQKKKIIRDTVASLRLDAVLSSGFSMSRGKALDYIKAGHVQVNYISCTKADTSVKQGDVFSVRGLGKCILEDCSGRSKKDRIGIQITRLM